MRRHEAFFILRSTAARARSLCQGAKKEVPPIGFRPISIGGGGSCEVPSVILVYYAFECAESQIGHLMQADRPCATGVRRGSVADDVFAAWVPVRRHACPNIHPGGPAGGALGPRWRAGRYRGVPLSGLETSGRRTGRCVRPADEPRLPRRGANGVSGDYNFNKLKNQPLSGGVRCFFGERALSSGSGRAGRLWGAPWRRRRRRGPRCREAPLGVGTFRLLAGVGGFPVAREGAFDDSFKIAFRAVCASLLRSSKCHRRRGAALLCPARRGALLPC